MTCNEMLCLVEFLLAHVQMLHCPLGTGKPANEVVEHAASDIAYRAIDHQQQWIEPCCLQAHHHGFARKGEETACYEGCNKHTPIAIVDKYVNK